MALMKVTDPPATGPSNGQTNEQAVREVGMRAFANPNNHKSESLLLLQLAVVAMIPS